MLGRIAERIGTPEFLETDEIGKLAAKIKEQLGSGLKTIIRTVINHGGKIRSGPEDPSEVCALLETGSGFPLPRYNRSRL